jgi:hypothetical protein
MNKKGNLSTIPTKEIKKRLIDRDETAKEMAKNIGRSYNLVLAVISGKVTNVKPTEMAILHYLGLDEENKNE